MPTATDPNTVDRNIPKGFFTYPMDIQDGAPFIYLGAYPYKSLVDATEYTASIKNVENRTYEAEFAFYVPKSLKFSYNPQIEQVAARIDPKLVSGLQNGDLKNVIKGSVSTGVNYLAASNKLDSALSVGLEAFKQWSQINSGMIFDPKQLNMYKDAPFMTYTLNYRFVPETASEASHIDVMLKVLRMLSQAKTAGSKNLQELIGLSDGLAKKHIELDKANEDVVKLEKLKEFLKGLKGTTVTKKDSTGNFVYDYTDAEKKTFNEYKKSLGKNADSTIGADITTASKKLNIETGTPPPKTDWEKKKEDIAEAIAAIQLTIGETWQAIKETRMDVWIHPHLFDLYLVIPDSNSSSTSLDSSQFKTINSQNEIDMYKGAKGLILSGLDISFIESPNRDDIPFYADKLPAGWEVNMTFTSVSKTTRS